MDEIQAKLMNLDISNNSVTVRHTKQQEDGSVAVEDIMAKLSLKDVSPADEVNDELIARLNDCFTDDPQVEWNILSELNTWLASDSEYVWEPELDLEGNVLRTLYVKRAEVEARNAWAEAALADFNAKHPDFDAMVKEIVEWATQEATAEDADCFVADK